MWFKKLDAKDRHTNCPRCNYYGCNSRSFLHHIKFILWLTKQNIKKGIREHIKRLTELDYSRIEDVQIDGIDTKDYPDFCDAFIASATYKGRDMTEVELDRLNEDRDFVYEKVQEYLY